MKSLFAFVDALFDGKIYVEAWAQPMSRRIYRDNKFFYRWDALLLSGKKRREARAAL